MAEYVQGSTDEGGPVFYRDTDGHTIRHDRGGIPWSTSGARPGWKGGRVIVEYGEPRAGTAVDPITPGATVQPMPPEVAPKETTQPTATTAPAIPWGTIALVGGGLWFLSRLGSK